MQPLTISEKRRNLLENYIEYISHTTSESGKSLTSHSWEFLTSVQGGRFMYLDSTLRETIAKVSNLGGEASVVIQEIKTGFHTLERYAVNLWRFPWRKEYHKIKVWIHEVIPGLVTMGR